MAFLIGFNNKLLLNKGDSDHVVHIDKLKSMFGWVPEVKLKTGIENILHVKDSTKEGVRDTLCQALESFPP